MSRVCSLFSGSKGNSTYIRCGQTSVLVDAGVSARMLNNRLKEYGTDLCDINAIFITHEHSDHIKGLEIITKHHNIPVFATEGTIRGMIAAFPVLAEADLRVIGDGEAVGELSVTAFSTSHDANQSCGFLLAGSDGKKTAVCTDLGYISESVKCAVRGCDMVIIESNHDVNMLKNGVYPAVLKHRILGMHGHLSNDACAQFLPELIDCGTTRVILGHISEENNTLPLALQTSTRALNNAGIRVGKDCMIAAASRIGIGKMYLL
ncbi:MAG: MBL fold metallo-hydrolase [Clostridia bacterium]|nr:MBL fold metallo-hydrolase [Clostridia bacterium]